MKYKLEDLIDIAHFQLLQDKLNEIYSFPSAIIDNDGNILTATAWQDVCTKFHRVDPECRKECIKSDQYIIDHLNEADPAVTYECPHGLVDNATPIIIDGVHYGNFFTGQFFLKNPDLEFFKSQTAKYGFNEEEYLEAVKKVPVWTKEQLNSYLFFIKGLIEVISSVGLKNLKEIETRKRFEESEKSLNESQNIGNLGSWEYDLTTNKAKWSENCFRLYGFEANEVLPSFELFIQIVHPDDRNIINTVFQNMHKDKGTSISECRIITKDGKLKWLQNNIKPEFADDVLVKLKGIQIDITSRKIAEEALADEAVRRRILMEQSSDGIVILDQNGNVFESNRKFAEMLGYSFESMRHLSVFDWEFLHPRESVLEMIRSVDENGDHFETRHRRKDGSIYEVEISTNAARFAGQKLIFCVCRDITERKRIEKELRSRNAELELFNGAVVNRELKMIELKKEVNKLLQQAGKTLKYDVDL